MTRYLKLSLLVGLTVALLLPQSSSIPSASGTGGTSVNVNGSNVTTPNFNATTPAAEAGYSNVKFQVSGSSVSAEVMAHYTASFLLCAGPCAANETSNWKWSAPVAATVTGCLLDAQTYPTGTGGTAVDVFKNGVVNSIFSSTVPTLAGGASAYNEVTGMSASATLAKGDYLTAKVTAVAGTGTGQFLNLVCTVTY